MEIIDYVLEAFPFLIAYAILLLEPGMQPLAENTLRTLVGPREKLEGWPRDLAVKLALLFYRQFSFITSVILSITAGLVVILSSDHYKLAVAAMLLFFVIFLIWVFRWQPLAHPPNEDRQKRLDKEMWLASAGTISLMLVLSLAVIVWSYLARAAPPSSATFTR